MTTTFTGNEVKVLEAVPPGGAALSSIRSGLSRTTTKRILDRLEERGLIEREPNPYGPETPWWYVRLPAAPEGFEPTEGLVYKDAIYDRGSAQERTWISLTGEINEHGCAVAWLHAGEHNQRKTWVPLHLLQKYPWYSRRRRGEVTAWSAQFACPVHGECSVEMVKTDKTCALCGSMLNRY